MHRLVITPPPLPCQAVPIYPGVRMTLGKLHWTRPKTLVCHLMVVTRYGNQLCHQLCFLILNIPWWKSIFSTMIKRAAMMPKLMLDDKKILGFCKSSATLIPKETMTLIMISFCYKSWILLTVQNAVNIQVNAYRTPTSSPLVNLAIQLSWHCLPGLASSSLVKPAKNMMSSAKHSLKPSIRPSIKPTIQGHFTSQTRSPPASSARLDLVNEDRSPYSCHHVTSTAQWQPSSSLQHSLSCPSPTLSNFHMMITFIETSNLLKQITCTGSKPSQQLLAQSSRQPFPDPTFLSFNTFDFHILPHPWWNL